ncbi:histidine kinase [Aureibaculum sp. 2210JD6-5]|uniref:tetratricopeptide repeat-containing sensor histidine kinase n=1 Tax=Aureibaculum sp. 2210JD6-5 TaxID=3103957 RepID=UPI002AAE47B1|nr:histidine kinase [Aureibaculum sp. 2210JD6-5]MDY7395664.1 histidine kinase [Aureibaculum sp. 2210JD6-5]
MFQKLLLSSIFFILCLTFCFSQQKKIDSLKKVITEYSSKDTTYVNLRLLYSRKEFIFNPRDSSLLKYNLKTLEFAKQLNFRKGEALVYNRIGVIYQYILSDPYKAIEYYHRSLDIVEKNKLPSKYMVGNIGNIANIYYEQKENKKALEYYKKMLSYPAYKMNAYGYIGNVYGNLNQLDSSANYYQKAIKIARDTKNYLQLGNNLSNLSLVLSKANKSAEAITTIEESLKLIETNKLEFIKAPAYANAAMVFLKNLEYDKAEHYALEGLNLKSALDNLFIKEKLWESLAGVYETKKEYNKAFDAYKNYIKLRDSITSTDRKLEISRKEIQFEADKENALANAEIKRQKIIRNSAMAGGGILLLTAILGGVFYKKRRDDAEKIKTTQFEAKVADTELKALRAQMNPHFIFNSLNSINDFIAKNNTKEANDYLVKFSKLTRSILENSDKKWISIAEEIELSELYMQLESYRLKDKFSYTIEVDSQIDKENTLIPPLILQPFIENSIWHGMVPLKEKGNITITIKQKDNRLICTIDDNGVGRSKNTAGNSLKKSRGISITQSRLEILSQMKKVKGSINLVDKQKGLKVELTLPLEHQF